MSTTQTWIRAELAASATAAFGAQLMIPADGLEFHGTDLVFHRQGEVVYVAEVGQLRSVTWQGKEPNPGLARRKAQWPNHGTRWTEEEREELKAQIAAGQPWPAISEAHGRSRSGVQQEAVKQGWVEAETLRAKPEALAPTKEGPPVPDPAPRPALEPGFDDERGET